MNNESQSCYENKLVKSLPSEQEMKIKEDEFIRGFTKFPFFAGGWKGQLKSAPFFQPLRERRVKGCGEWEEEGGTGEGGINYIL